MQIFGYLAFVFYNLEMCKVKVEVKIAIIF